MSKTASNSKTPYYRTQAAANKALLDVFDKTGKERPTPIEIFRSQGFSFAEDQKERNRKWLSTQLMSLRAFGYGDKNANSNGTTDYVYMTENGQRALAELKGGNAANNLQTGTGSSTEDPVTFGSVKRDVKTLKEQFPDLDIVFKVELKEEASMT